MGRCALCGGGSLVPWKPGEPAVVQCLACGGAQLQSMPEAKTQVELYQGEYYREGTGRRFLGPLDHLLVRLKGAKYRAIASRCARVGALLDVGCGRGDLLEQFQRKGWQAVGTQLSRTAAEAARKRGVEVLEGELPGLLPPGARFEVITFFHVLEHLPDPEAYLHCAHGLLDQGGLLVVEAPNLRTLGFHLLGRRNLCFDFPYHLHFVTSEGLGCLLERCGFSVEKVAHFSLEISPFTTLQNWLNLLPGQPNRLYRSLMGNPAGLALRHRPLTWVHLALGCLLGPLALLASLPSLLCPWGNTLRVYARKR